MRLEENERIAAIRWETMGLKARYLAGEDVEKPAFRAGFVDTEEYFDHAPVSALDGKSQEYLKSFDIRSWYLRKYENWKELLDIKKDGVRIIAPEGKGGYPLSLVLLFDNGDERDRVRKELIERQVYPAILWNVPSPTDGEVFKFSRGMLSIHCDGRYSAEDIKRLIIILNGILN